jgi:hypothetical protein
MARSSAASTAILNKRPRALVTVTAATVGASRMGGVRISCMRTAPVALVPAGVPTW